MFRVIGSGSQPINWKNVIVNWPKGFAAFIGQKTLFKTRPIIGFIHALVAWGFTFYLIVNVVDVIYGFIPDFHLLPNHFIGDAYRFFVDSFSVLVLLGVVYFLVRRFIVGDEKLATNQTVMLSDAARVGMRKDSLLVGLFIISHVGFRFLSATFEIAQHQADWSQPAATLLSGLWQNMDLSSLVLLEHISWWLALGLILGFLPYFPYSKHAHLFMGPLNFMVNIPRRSMATLEMIDFEDEKLEQYGAGQFHHLPQTQLLDAYACIQCSRCQDACPAYQTGKELSPSAIEINKRYFVNENLSKLSDGQLIDIPLTQWMLSEEAAWSCTTCGYCVEVCPVGNEPMVDILRARQDLVMMESNFPKDAMESFDKMENYGNPWGLSPQDREKWMEGRNVPLMREKKEADVLYWAGCSGAYDSRGKEISQAVVDVMNKAGVDFATLGNEETCTGDSARRIGNEYLFQMMATQNLETFEQYKFKKIVTQCPHCFSTLKNDYAELGTELDVVHHSQFIGELVSNGKIKPEPWMEDDVTYHDACYLGRHNGEYDAPRDVIQSIMKGGNLVEMEQTKEESFCCGAGGGNMWYEIDKGERINKIRFNEAASTGAKTVATACNFCNIMMEDGMKVTGHDQDMKVMDIAEMVMKGL
ncbi:MAG: (Fe-S)-binding protein [Candidatus Marinimicrobia bacterium]|jgi:Fe-S oxidoreductase|nr:(Fe-S)-binding protein [Candidatus Neomarinimicrobiota bacterium]MBT3838971.1 (Fe-S)-binding protein [Candidatus Neomarinimicrobiota bacterium]MBT3999702.1 (Fe-S)-binding protein [Candidatus Neomarinimicrobiota bacterium]MBT4282471.1 (Fe-S)-binding protein [Candidatus Neomarinimicrobiota bacterium]MBT4579785.1 (Fe-S)-binding protein [Candidatus Neomarinimicrobiota bacterium]